MNKQQDTMQEMLTKIASLTTELETLRKECTWGSTEEWIEKARKNSPPSISEEDYSENVLGKVNGGVLELRYHFLSGLFYVVSLHMEIGEEEVDFIMTGETNQI